MLIVGTPPREFAAALSALSKIPEIAALHPACAKGVKITCIQSSLIGASLLRHAGFDGSKAVPVRLVFQTMDKERRSFVDQRVVGTNDGFPLAPKGEWNGHMVIVAAGYLIDLTLSQFSNSSVSYPPMLALPLLPPGQKPIAGLTQLARVRAGGENVSFDLGWLHAPKNTQWKNSGSQKNKFLAASIRRFVIDRLITTSFGPAIPQRMTVGYSQSSR